MKCAAGPGTYRVRRIHRARVTELVCYLCRQYGRGECQRLENEQILRALK